jgi:hypothetical protein
VLLQLRGLSRDELLGRLHARAEPPASAAPDEQDLEAAVEAALYAVRLLADDPLS